MCSFFATLNRWRFRVEERWIKKTHLCFIQQDPPLRGFLSVSSLLINFLRPLLLSLSLSFSSTHTLCNERTHTHTPTQAVRNHKTCCFLSCSDDNLLATRGKCFSQPIRKLIRQCGEVSCQGFWGFRQKYQRESDTGSRQVFGTNPHLIFFTVIVFLYWRFSGSAGGAVTSQWEGPGFDSRSLTSGVWIFSPTFPRPVVFRPKTCKVTWTGD